MNKSELILSLPRSLTASQVVAEAKKRGVKLSSQLVYVVRRKSGAGAPKRGPGRPRKHPLPARAPTHKTTASRASSGTLTADEKELARIVAVLGLKRVDELLGRLR